MENSDKLSIAFSSASGSTQSEGVSVQRKVSCCYQLDKMYPLFSTATLGCGVEACLFITIELFKGFSSRVK